MPKPKSFSEAYPITCTTRELFVRQSVPRLSPDLAEAVSDWCRAHGLELACLPVGRPIIRDPAKRTLTIWQRDGLDEVQHVVQAPPDAPKVWPAPFPAVLLQQPVPSVCPTCGRDSKKPIPTEETA